MSLAPAAYLLYQNVMRHDPSDPHWLGRDRFVLSAGHTALTQYIQLYYSGYGLELDDIKALRTWGSKTPGHPEYRHTEGVEVTTGPLGQGLANAVGMATAARRHRGRPDPDAAPRRRPPPPRPPPPPPPPGGPRRPPPRPPGPGPPPPAGPCPPAAPAACSTPTPPRAPVPSTTASTSSPPTATSRRA